MSTCITPTDSKIDSLIFYTAQEKINSICGNSVLFLIWYTITCPVSCINRLALRACSETKLLNSIRSSIDCSSNNISVHTRIVVHIYSYKKKSDSVVIIARSLIFDSEFYHETEQLEFFLEWRIFDSEFYHLTDFFLTKIKLCIV